MVISVILMLLGGTLFRGYRDAGIWSTALWNLASSCAGLFIAFSEEVTAVETCLSDARVREKCSVWN